MIHNEFLQQSRICMCLYYIQTVEILFFNWSNFVFVSFRLLQQKVKRPMWWLNMLWRYAAQLTEKRHCHHLIASKRKLDEHMLLLIAGFRPWYLCRYSGRRPNDQGNIWRTKKACYNRFITYILALIYLMLFLLNIFATITYKTDQLQVRC